MKNKYLVLALSMIFMLPSCETFLNRPAEDSYNTDNYYTSDAACISGVNYLYNSPWYDFQRGFIKVGEVFSGNMYWGSCPYLNFSVNGTDVDLVNMSYSLWAEIAHCSTVYESLKNAQGCSQSVVNQCMGECLAWKAMAYFFLVRSFGDVPIIHSNSESLAKADYNEQKKVEKADVYDYIILTLEKAIELLPTQGAAGRIDQYCAKGLLAKVYLTKAGVKGQLNNDDLQKAYDLAVDVKNNSGRALEANYADIFLGHCNKCPESLFAWRWTVGSQWTSQNTLQSDLGIVGFDEFGDVWGGWGGPSADLMAAFGVIEMTGESGVDAEVAAWPDPTTTPQLDTRRKATMMTAGDHYTYFWRDKTYTGPHASGKGAGFDYLDAIYDTEDAAYGKAFSEGQCQGPCGSNWAKHMYGDNADHVAETGISAARMAYAYATHILRLADVYLVAAEAAVLMNKGTDAEALDAFNKVHQRAVPSATPVASLTFDQVWKERRLELAGEGDRWYDFVRRAYYDMDVCIAEIKAQYRNQIWNCDAMFKAFWLADRSGWSMTIDPEKPIDYNNDAAAPNVTPAVFTLPFPNEDVALNPNLKSDAPAIHVDVRATYQY